MYYTIFYRCSDNAGPYYADDITSSGVYYYGGDGQLYRVDHYSDDPEGEKLNSNYLYYVGSSCTPYFIFYRCGDSAEPYYAQGPYDWGVYYCGNDGNYYIVWAYGYEPYGSEISNLSYYGPNCPRTIFYRCNDSAGPYWAERRLASGVYYYSDDGQYYRVDHYSPYEEGSWLDDRYLSYYGPTCPGGPSFNPAWALYTNTYIGNGHV